MNINRKKYLYDYNRKSEHPGEYVIDEKLNLKVVGLSPILGTKKRTVVV